MTGTDDARSPAPDAFRVALSRFATGVTVVTTCSADGQAHGMTANAFTSVSLAPLLVLVCIARDANMYALVERVGRFAVTMLAEDQEDISRWFSSPGRPPGPDQFDGVAWKPGPVTGCPLLTDGLAYVECTVDAVHPAGDHAVVVGAVASHALLRDGEPLVFFGGRYRRLREDDA